MLAACGNNEPVPIADAPEARFQNSTVWHCADGYQALAADLGQEDAVIALPEGVVTLPRLASTEGTKYGNAEETTIFWKKGDEATVENMGSVHPGCGVIGASTPALAGAETSIFRGLGNEPGWLLDVVDGGNITLVADYGTTTVVEPTPEPSATEVTGGEQLTYRFSNEGRSIMVLLEPAVCQDTMAGLPYPWKVTVLIDSSEYLGCGMYGQA